jgi:hypothetical protein
MVYFNLDRDGFHLGIHFLLDPHYIMDSSIVLETYVNSLISPLLLVPDT